MRDSWEAYKLENGITEENVSVSLIYQATKAVDTTECEDGCGVMGLSKRGKIERLENPKEDWFLGHILPE